MITVETDHPVARDSNDHLVPWGTKNDNTHHMPFVHACERLFGARLSYLDLGCSGGGLVKDFIDRGHFAVGIEGSDYSQKIKRAEWATIPDNLFTADLTKPFRVTNGSDCQFDVISAWEVLEHIAEPDLPQFFANIRAHLAAGGVFLGSISMFSDEHDGTEYHKTIRPFDWWGKALYHNGFIDKAKLSFEFSDMARGTGKNGDFSFAEHPAFGCHFAVMRT